MSTPLDPLPPSIVFENYAIPLNKKDNRLKQNTTWIEPDLIMDTSH